MNELLRCREWIESALEYSGDTHDFADIAEGIAEGRMQLWPTPRGCLVTEIVVYPKKRILHIFLAGGEMDQLTDMHEDVIAWAREQGCSSMTLSGRFGWKKALQKFGWEPQLVVLEKEFEA